MSFCGEWPWEFVVDRISSVTPSPFLSFSATTMSSEIHNAPKAKHIQIRRIQLNDPSQLPCDYSTTPGGTLFSTTPGGTRIVYDRAFLMQCRNSPLAKSPPANLPKIPGVTCPMSNNNVKEPQKQRMEPVAPKVTEDPKTPASVDDPQFEMDL